MKRVTLYAQYKSTQALADTRIAELQTQNKQLLKLGTDLAERLEAKLDTNTEIMQTINVRHQAKKMIVQHVPAIEETINNMFLNFDKGMQKTYTDIREKYFKNAKAFTKAFEQFMKGHDKTGVDQFVAEISQMIPKQNEGRKQEIINQETASSKAERSLGNVFKRAYLAVVHFFAVTFTNKYATVDQAVEQTKSQKALVSRSGYTVEEKEQPKHGKKSARKFNNKPKRGLQDRAWEERSNAQKVAEKNEKAHEGTEELRK